MFHLLAFATDSMAASSSWTSLDAVADGVISKVQSSYFQTEDAVSIVAAYALGSDLEQARSIRSLNCTSGPPVFLRPIDRAAVAPRHPNLVSLTENPAEIDRGDPFSVQALTGGTTNVRAFLWIAGQLVALPPGLEIITVRATSSDAATADTWTEVDVAFEMPRREGLFALVGSEVCSATGLAHRWIFPNQSYRPGGLSITSYDYRTPALFRNGNLGIWGTMESVLPRLEVFCNSTDSDHVAYVQFARLPNSYASAAGWAGASGGGCPCAGRA